jgi:antitoxin SocA-like protein
LTVDYDEGKFAEALLYVASKLLDDPAGGAVKINKALFNADFGHMRAHGRPITGADYQKLPYGPAPRRLLPVRSALIEAGDAALREEVYLGRTVKRLVPLRSPDVSSLAATEREMLDQAIDVERRRSGAESTAASHSEPGWQIVDQNESIPYESAFLRQPVVTDRVRQRVAELAAERSLS